MAGELTLEKITSANWRETLGVRLAQGQSRFVADYEPVALVILAKSYVRSGGMDWSPYAIRHQGDLVGLFALARSGAAFEMYHFVIDRHFQSRGLGKRAATLILELAGADPVCELVRLTVHPENLAARRVYAACGFTDTGEYVDGEPVMEYRIR